MTTKAPPGHFTLLYFASAATFTNKSSEHLPAPLKVTDLFDALEERYPGMKRKVLGSCAVTVNLEYTDVEVHEEEGETASEVVIREADEVAIIPPVSSG